MMTPNLHSTFSPFSPFILEQWLYFQFFFGVLVPQLLGFVGCLELRGQLASFGEHRLLTVARVGFCSFGKVTREL
jgi:hypothetical protein